MYAQLLSPKTSQGLAEGEAVVRGHQQTRELRQHFGHATDARRDDRHAARHRFEHDVGNALVVAGQAQHVCCSEPVPKQRVVEPSHELHAVRKTALGRALAYRRPRFAITNEDEPEPGVRRGDFDEGIEQIDAALGDLQVADVEHDGPGTSDAASLARDCTVRGLEPCRVDTVVDDLNMACGDAGRDEFVPQSTARRHDRAAAPGRCKDLPPLARNVQIFVHIGPVHLHEHRRRRDPADGDGRDGIGKPPAAQDHMPAPEEDRERALHDQREKEEDRMKRLGDPGQVPEDEVVDIGPAFAAFATRRPIRGRTPDRFGPGDRDQHREIDAPRQAIELLLIEDASRGVPREAEQVGDDKHLHARVPWTSDRSTGRASTGMPPYKAR